MRTFRVTKPSMCGAFALALASAALAQTTGPSSSQSPYVLPAVPGEGVETVSLLTVGDSISGYRMVGIPDGMGAFLNDDGETFTLLLNHELSSSRGIARAHGGIGAFVSKWTIDRNTLEVLAGSDLIRSVYIWNAASAAYELGTNVVFNRFCSADLPAESAFYNQSTGLGSTTRLFMNGEEAGAEGRAFAHIVDGPNAGQSWELPWLGKFSWENSVASPYTGDATVVIGLDDSSPGQVYVYVGAKSGSGTEIERAGLTNGRLYGIAVQGVIDEDRLSGLGENVKRFDLVSLGDVSGKSGATVQSESEANGVTEFLRPEDGHWDPRVPSDFYFVTTDQYDQTKDGIGTNSGRSRLYRLRFDDVTNPALGGEIETLLDGTEATQMMDNMTMDRFGNVIIQEDVGNQQHNGKIWSYDIASDSLSLVAKHDAERFGDIGTGAAPPFSQDEESSGVIDAHDILGAGWLLINDQAHYSTGDAETVEGGQLLAMYSPGSNPALNLAVSREKDQVTISWSGATVNSDLTLLYATRVGNVVIPGGNPCAGVQLGLGSRNLRIVRTINSGAGSGEIVGSSTVTGFLQIVDPADCATSNVVTF